ncbi:hypothetical protein SEVIR_9G077166v4 [Setaria viridis]|uniref:Uncharacterized protein n=1 Tax=Setaria viridis TaxID=4556 RepID=A0A4U6SVB3_SETVI|nr:hypothetical protein SEVIR_9G077166v2 [Setaria viridis]
MENRVYSTGHPLAGEEVPHTWGKKIAAARDLKPEEFTQVRAVAVNCRSRASPAVPLDFFGNMVLWAFPWLQVTDLLNSIELRPSVPRDPRRRGARRRRVHPVPRRLRGRGGRKRGGARRGDGDGGRGRHD